MKIYCPICEKYLFDIDEKSKMNKEMVCSRCNKLIVYSPENREVHAEEKPPRTTSSGCRFW